MVEQSSGKWQVQRYEAADIRRQGLSPPSQHRVSTVEATGRICGWLFSGTFLGPLPHRTSGLHETDWLIGGANENHLTLAR